MKQKHKPLFLYDSPFADKLGAAKVFSLRRSFLSYDTCSVETIVATFVRQLVPQHIRPEVKQYTPFLVSNQPKPAFTLLQPYNRSSFRSLLISFVSLLMNAAWFVLKFVYHGKLFLYNISSWSQSQQRMGKCSASSSCWRRLSTPTNPSWSI